MKKKTGVSLIELLISVIILFVVMIGVAAVDQTLKRSHSTSSRSSEVALRLTAVMLHIINNAALAHGVKDNPGVVVNLTASEWQLTIRKAANNPFSFTDDIFIRYWSDTSGIMRYCPNWTLGACSSTPEILANNIVFDASSNQFNFVANNTLPDPEVYLEVNLQAMYNVNKGLDPMTNPKELLSTRIHMPGQTWNFNP